MGNNIRRTKPLDWADIMTIEVFKNAVDGCNFIDYDGTGYYLDDEGQEVEIVSCAELAKKKLEEVPYKKVAWYNRRD